VEDVERVGEPQTRKNRNSLSELRRLASKQRKEPRVNRRQDLLARFLIFNGAGYFWPGIFAIFELNGPPFWFWSIVILACSTLILVLFRNRPWFPPSAYYSYDALAYKDSLRDKKPHP
jgi:hypothetical protein